MKNKVIYIVRERQSMRCKRILLKNKSCRGFLMSFREKTDQLEFQNEELLEKIEKAKTEKQPGVLTKEGKKKEIERVTTERDEAKETFENMKKENEQEIRFSK